MNKNPYDIILIGAGLGSLITGALLSKEGYKVLLLEKNKQIGGCLQSFGIDAKLFESAVHYIGSMEKGQTLHTLFHYLDIADKLQLQRLDIHGYDEIWLGNTAYRLAQGYDNFIEQLSAHFPDQKEGLVKFVDYIKYVCAHFPLYNLRLGSQEEKMKVVGVGLQEILDQYISNATLQEVLCGNNLLFAGDRHETPFYLYALIQNSYIESSWKFKEGSAQLARLLQEIIIANGGIVERNADVTFMQEENGQIQYVETKEGKRYFGKNYISGIHPQRTYEMIQSNLIRKVTRRRIEETPNTLSAFMVNVTLKPNTIAYTNHNIYYHKDNNVWKDIDEHNLMEPNSYGIYFYPDKNNNLYASGLSVLCYMNINRIPFGAETFRTTSHRQSRGEDYEKWKQQMAQQIIQQIEGVIPGISEAADCWDACSPLTYRDYLNTPQGSMYGFKKNVKDLANTTYATRTKISNLFLTGQNINLHGVLGVSITGILTASEFVGLPYLVNKINQTQ